VTKSFLVNIEKNQFRNQT